MIYLCKRNSLNMDKYEDVTNGCPKFKEVVERGDEDEILVMLRAFAYVNGTRSISEYSYLRCIEATPSLLEDDEVELVTRVCIKLHPRGILTHYLRNYEVISRRVAHALMKASNMGIESGDIRNFYSPHFLKDRGLERLLYLERGDV